jgi:hypothetical protein
MPPEDRHALGDADFVPLGQFRFALGQFRYAYRYA